MMAKREFSLRTNVEVENDDDHIYGSFFHVSSKLNAPKRMDELRKAKLRHSERYDDFNSRSKNDKYANETIELIKQRKAKDRNKAELSDILARMKINEVDEKHILPNVKVKVDIKTSLIRNNGLPSLVNEPKRTTKITESRNIRNNFGPYANSKLVISERNRRYFVNIDHSLEDYRLSLNKFKANKPSFLQTKNLLEPSGNTSVHRNQHRMDSRNLEPIVETKLETTQVIGEVKPNAEKETATESRSKRVVKIKSPIQIIINEAPKEEEEINESKENEPPTNTSRSESSRAASSTDEPRLGGLRELIRAELLKENNEKEENKDQDERVLELEVTEKHTEVEKPLENENKEFAQTIDEIQSSNQEARENTDGEQVEGDNDENDEETQQDAEQIEELEEETIRNQDDDKDEQKESESISSSHVNRDDNEQANENRIMLTENLEDDEYENGDSSSTEINDNNDEENANNDNDSDFVIVENDENNENNENEMMENVEENSDKPAEDRQEPDYETPEELKGVNVNEEKAEADEGSKSNYNQSYYQQQENDDNNDVVIPNNDDEEIYSNKSNDDNKNNEMIDLLASDENEVVKQEDEISIDKNTEDEATQLRDIIANLNREMAEYQKDLAEEAIEFENRQEILNETSNQDPSNQEPSNPEQIEEIEMEEWQKKETRISVKLELDSRSSKYGFDYRIVQINGHIPIRIPRIYRVDIGLSAHAAGIRDGDFIVKINDTYTSDLSYEEVQSRLYERLNEVELRIRRIDE